MKGILPAILAHTKTELEQQLQRLKWASKIQLDIMDGKFVPKKTYSLPQTLLSVKNKTVQAHLMVQNPKSYLRKLKHVKEIIYHAETGQDLLDEITQLGPRAGISFNPTTRISTYKHLIARADIAQIMTVIPGKMGQRFMHEQLKKIAQIKSINPQILIGVDGGVNATNIKHIWNAGADYAAIGSALHTAKNPREEYLLLKRKTNTS